MSLVLDVDDEVGRPRLAARLEFGVCLDAVHVVGEPDAAAEFVLVDDLPRCDAHLAQDRPIVHVGLVVDDDLAIAPRYDGKGDDTVAKFLRCEVGKRDKVALVPQVLRDLLRLRLKVGERRLVVAMRREDVPQLGIGHGVFSVKCIACDPYTLCRLLCCLFGGVRGGGAAHGTEGGKACGQQSFFHAVHVRYMFYVHLIHSHVSFCLRAELSL